MTIGRDGPTFAPPLCVQPVPFEFTDVTSSTVYGPRTESLEEVNWIAMKMYEWDEIKSGSYKAYGTKADALEWVRDRTKKYRSPGNIVFNSDFQPVKIRDIGYRNDWKPETQTILVVPTIPGSTKSRWAVWVAGNDRPSRVHDRKSNAESDARSRFKRTDAPYLAVYKRIGTLQKMRAGENSMVR